MYIKTMDQKMKKTYMLPRWWFRRLYPYA